MLESVVSNKVKNIGQPFTDNCDAKLSIGSWFEAENLKNSNRIFRKRYYPSTFDKEHLSNQSPELVWKRRREYINKQSDPNWNRNKNNRKFKADSCRKYGGISRMTRTSCCQIRRHNDTRYVNNRNDHSEYDYSRNRSLSQSNDGGMCLPHHQLPIIDNSSDSLRHQIASNRRHLNPNILHTISTQSPHTLMQGKEALTAPTGINNYCNIQTTQITRAASPCGVTNHFPVAPVNSIAFRQPHQLNNGPQSTRRRHHTTDLTSSYQTGASPPSQYLQSRPVNVPTSQPSVSVCNIPNRNLSNNTSSFPLVTRSFCQNQNQLRFVTTYPINPYSPQHQAVFSRTSLPGPNILPPSSAFCSTVPMPTVINDVLSSTPCHQCAMMAGSTGLNTFSNLSSMFQLSVAPAAASLITLAPLPGDRMHGSRLSYLPVQAINNWHNHHPFMSPAWSYNDLSSILHNSAVRHILQDHLAQRLLSTSPNIGIQFVMMTPSSLLGSNEPPQIRHHFIPVSRTDSMSPITVSRYLPIIDHFPFIDQPRPGITKQELDQIPVKKFVKNLYDNSVVEDSKDRCMICLEDFMPNEIIRLLKCSHDFHSSCVERWLKINRTCPLCRADAAGPCHRKS